MSQEDRRYSISEVSELAGVETYVLRQWESRFPQLKPKRNRAGRRWYSMNDIAIVRRIKYYLHHEGLTTDGAIKRLDQELHGHGRPKTSDEALRLIDHIEAQARDMLNQLDSFTS